MTLAEYMAAHNGQWMDGAAVVMDRGGYYTRLAVGSESSYELTSDGKRLLGTPVKTKPLVDTSTDVVHSQKKRGKKTAVSTDELNLDDL